MKIVIESHIPYVKGLLEPWAEVEYLEPGDITREAVADADAVLVRTRTRCDEGLLGGTRVKFVGTCTIGTDHIDLDWCAAHGIAVANAPGCNAPAVADYVLSSAGHIAQGRVEGLTIGIVGVGHVGKIVSSRARALGMTVLECDPPRERAEGGSHWSTLDEIAARADIVTFHTPLTDAGPDATVHMAGKAFFERLERRAVIVNAARGPVVNTPDLVEALKQGRVSHAVIDTWEHEPHISQELLRLATIATPHIAGYSAEGKVRGTRMVLDALTRRFAMPEIEMDVPLPPAVAMELPLDAMMDAFDPAADTRALRERYAAEGAAAFESLRNNYRLRAEARDGGR